MNRSPRFVLLTVLLFVLVAVMPFMASAQEEDFPPADGEALLDYVLETNPYTEWGTWPDPEVEGFLQSAVPHGEVVRIFVNDVALSVADEFPGEMPEHSIIVKENYTGDDPAEPGDLDALTIMYKVSGFAPETGDWFWIKSSGDGSTIDAAGTPEGCINCHGGVEGHRDYILRYGFEGEPALASAELLPAELAPAPAEEPETLPETGAASQVSTTALFLFAAAAVALVIAGGLWLTSTRSSA